MSRGIVDKLLNVFGGFSKNLCFIYEVNFAFPFAEFIKEENDFPVARTCSWRTSNSSKTHSSTHSPTNTTAHLQGDYFMTRCNRPFVLSFNPSPQERRSSSLIRELLVCVLVPTTHFEILPACGTVRPSVTNYCSTDAVRHV